MGKISSFINDGLRSFIGALGDPSRDKAASTYYTATDISLDQLEVMYDSSWLVKNVVNYPAEDSLGKWRKWQADINQVELIEATEQRLGLQEKLIECKTTARLCGGAAIYIGTDQDAALPLDPTSIKQGGLKHLSVLTRYELTAGEIQNDPREPYHKQPKHFEISGAGVEAKIHPSRLVRFRGARPADLNGDSQDDGWGKSVIQSVNEYIHRADATAANIASLTHEAKIDIVKIKDLSESLSTPEGEQRLLSRFRLAMTNKSLNNTLVLDEFEAYEQKQVNFAGLPDILKLFILCISGASGIPVTRLLGQSPAGLNSTGEGDMKNYYDRIARVQTLENAPAMRLLDECILHSSLGKRPAEIWFSWNPLEQMNEKQIAEIGKLTAETSSILGQSGLFMPEELRAGTTGALVEIGMFPDLANAVAKTDSAGGFDLGEEKPDEKEVGNE